MPATNSQNGNNMLIILAVILIAIAAVGSVFLMQDNRSGSERVGDAVQALPNGVDKAADELGDQAPAENVERNLDEAKEKVS